MRNAYVHVGLPKTGTTAIQTAMAKNRGRLREHGFLYPGDEVDHATLIAPFHVMGERHYYHAARGLTEQAALAQGEVQMAQIAASARDFDGHLILSSEYLFNMGQAKLQEMDEWLGGLGFRMVLVCYVRHPFAAATSSTQQSMKMGGGQATLEQLIEKPRWHNSRITLEPALRVLSRDRIIVRAFEDTRDVGVVGDFLNAISYEGPRESFELPKVNESLSMAAVLLADAHNQLTAGQPRQAVRRDYFFRIGGPRFSLPRSALERIRPAAQQELDWLQQTFGLTLPEPAAGPDPEAGVLTPEVARQLVALILKLQ